MSVYHELPKASINTILKRRFSKEELDLVKDQIQTLLSSSQTIEQLQFRIQQVIKSKRKANTNSIHIK